MFKISKFKFIYLFLILITTQSALANFVFSKDGRPYDGQLNEIEIANTMCATPFKKALITQKIAFYDRVNHGEVETNQVIVSGVDCNFHYVTRRNQVIKKINCLRDDRPVDGALTQILFEINAAGLYDVTHNTWIHSRVEHRVIKTSSILGEDLELK